MIQSLSETQTLTIRKPLDSFLIPLKICLFLGIVLSLPWGVYHVWVFIAPALYKNEKKIIVPLVISTTVLFYLGILFAYFVVLPLTFQFLSSVAPNGTQYSPDISDYVSLVITIFLAFGFAFEVPIATILLVLVGVVEVTTLKEKRRYFIVFSFIVAMLLTPPDIISQTLLAIPMLILFETGLFFATYLKKNKLYKQ